MTPMNRLAAVLILTSVFLLSSTNAVRADTIEGVITSYESGNQGTDLMVRTDDGRMHDLWFDNMKKPLFKGKPLPWCPSFPCAGWPPELALNKTRVRIDTVRATIDGKAIDSPTRIGLVSGGVVARRLYVGPAADVAAVKATMERRPGVKVEGAHVAGDFALIEWAKGDAEAPEVLKRISGDRWKLILDGGGVMPVSAMVHAGVPAPIAHELCSNWPKGWRLCEPQY